MLTLGQTHGSAPVSHEIRFARMTRHVVISSVEAEHNVFGEWICGREF